MIKDKPVRVVQWFMTGVEKYLLRHFSSVKYLSPVEVSREKATMVLTNHFSFYDGAILHRLCRKVLKKHFKVMVVEAQMRNFKPLRYIGCFSVDRKSRSVIESLNYAAELLNDPSNMLGIYPQGEVYSVHLNRIHFENGLQHILNKTRKPVQVIFSVVLTDYLDSFKPQARVYLDEYKGALQLAEMEAAYNDFYSSCKEQQRALHNPPMRVRG